MAYNPDLHIVSNKPYATAQAEPIDARAYFYDAALFKYRAYQSTAEVISYLNAPEYRTGQFSIIINLTGTLQLNGTYTDTHITEWWFKDGVADINLVPKCSDCFNENGLTRFGIEDNLGLQDRAVDMQIQDLIITNMGTGQFAAGDVTYAGPESELYITPGFSNLYSQLDGNINSSVNVDSGQSYIVSYDGSSFETLTVSATHITLDDNTNSWNNSDPTKFITTDSSGNLVLTSVPAAPTYTFADSIVNTAGTVTFVNDVLSPPASYYYGTNVSGTKGWFILPSPGANRVEPLQETCDVGHTTTTSIIIGSSNTAHSGVAGQLVVGTSSAATSAATNGVALNNSTVSGVNSTGVNSSSASGATSFAANTSSASGVGSAAFGSSCSASGDNSVATGVSSGASGVASFTSGTGNTSSGANSASFGTLNSVTGRQCMAIGTQNTSADSGTSGGSSRGNSLAVGWLNSVTRANSVAIGRSNSVQGGDSCVSLGISNIQTGYEYQTGMPAGAMQGAGAVAIGGVNTTTGDFAVAIGFGNTATGKYAVALGKGAKTVCPGEIVFATGGPSTDTIPSRVGQCQTSIAHFTRYDGAPDPASSTTRFLYVGGDENRQSDGRPANGFDTVWGKTWYPLETLNVYYITGKMTGITSTGDICVWTIETYLKNVAGTITGGTTSFTNVLRDAAFVTMDTVTLDTSLTDSGTTKQLLVKYNNTGASYPIAKYSCLMTITKLGW